MKFFQIDSEGKKYLNTFTSYRDLFRYVYKNSRTSSNKLEVVFGWEKFYINTDTSNYVVEDLQNNWREKLEDYTDNNKWKCENYSFEYLSYSNS